MLSKTFTLLFYLKRRSTYVAGDLPIYLRVTVDGERFEIATQRHCDPNRWNSLLGRKNGNREDAKVLNAYLDTLQASVYEAQRSISNVGKQVTAKRIKDKLTGIQERPLTICEIFRDHNEQMRALVGKDCVRSTYNRYETSLKNVQEFLLFKYRVTDIRVGGIRLRFHIQLCVLPQSASQHLT